MPKEKVVIEFSETDLKQLLCEKYNLNISSATLQVTHYPSNPREPEYTSLTISGEKKQ